MPVHAIPSSRTTARLRAGAVGLAAVARTLDHEHPAHPAADAVALAAAATDQAARQGHHYVARASVALDAAAAALAHAFAPGAERWTPASRRQAVKAAAAIARLRQQLADTWPELAATA